MKHEVRDGGYDLMEVSLDFLCRKFEGVGINEFVAAEYGETPDFLGQNVDIAA